MSRPIYIADNVTLAGRPTSDTTFLLRVPCDIVDDIVNIWYHPVTRSYFETYQTHETAARDLLLAFIALLQLERFDASALHVLLPMAQSLHMRPQGAAATYPDMTWDGTFTAIIAALVGCFNVEHIRLLHTTDISVAQYMQMASHLFYSPTLTDRTRQCLRERVILNNMAQLSTISSPVHVVILTPDAFVAVPESVANASTPLADVAGRVLDGLSRDTSSTWKTILHLSDPVDKPWESSGLTAKIESCYATHKIQFPFPSHDEIRA